VIKNLTLSDLSVSLSANKYVQDPGRRGGGKKAAAMTRMTLQEPQEKNVTGRRNKLHPNP